MWMIRKALSAAVLHEISCVPVGCPTNYERPGPPLQGALPGPGVVGCRALAVGMGCSRIPALLLTGHWSFPGCGSSLFCERVIIILG